MNKKYLNIILLVLLIFIWGAVFIKYFGFNKISPNSTTIGFTSNYSKKYNIFKDTFELKLNELDPFRISGKIIKTPVVNKVEISPKTTVKPIHKNVVWPSITYHGFVKSEGETTRLILLKINNKLFKKRENETIADITLIKAYNDSLIVSLNNTKKIIKK